MTFKLNNSLKLKNSEKNNITLLFKPSKNALGQKFIDSNTKNLNFFVENENCNKFNEFSTPWAKNYGFPFYLNSVKNYDAILVKDIGTTCDIIKSENNIIQLNYLKDEIIAPKQVKSNSSEFLSVTKKLSAYTKSFFGNFTIKASKTSRQTENTENHDKVDKIPIATEYFDFEGKPCLKLRLEYVKKQSNDNLGISNVLEKTKKESKDRTKSKLQFFFLEMQTNNQRKSSLLSISSLFNNLKSEISKKETQIACNNNSVKNSNLIHGDKIKLSKDEFITSSNYCKKMKTVHSSSLPHQHYH